MLSVETVAYIQGFTGKPDVLAWAQSHLSKYLESNTLSTSDIEHIVDFLASNKAPKRISRMSVKEAIAAAEKWTKSLQKKAEKVIESPSDTEIVLDFKDGFKVVKLLGKSAFEREGYLMGHCVASYFGKADTIYSLRDSENKPHCTMSKDSQQIKGKGNGSIDPKYINYIVQFLEHLGIEVRDSEMANLGYANIENVEDDNAVFYPLFREKYFYKGNKIVDKHGADYQSVSLWGVFDIFTLTANLSIKWNFDVALSIKTFITNCKKKNVKHATGYQSAASNTGYRSAASNTGDQSAASNTGYRSAASNTGNRSAASNTGYQSAASNTGDQSAASNTGDQSAASNTGYQSAASNTGCQSAASNTGDQSAAFTIGFGSKASVESSSSVAFSSGLSGMAMGKKGSWIVLVERDVDWNILAIKSAQIDGKTLKETVWYTLKGGEFTEVTE